MTTARFEFTTRARPIIEIGLGSSSIPTGQAQWDVSKWDDTTVTQTWAGSEPTWREVTCEGISVHIESGRARLGDRFEPSTADVTFLNLDGWADPFSTIPPYGVLALRPGREIRVGIVHDDYGTVWRFRGYIDTVDPVYLADDDDMVILQCVDALSEVGRSKVASSAVVGADETASARFAHILDAAPWIAGRRLIDDDTTPMVAAAMSGQVVDMLQRTAASIGGYAFGDTAGRIVLRDRTWLYYDDTEDPDAIVGNGAAAGDALTTNTGDPLTTDTGDPLITDATALDSACPTGWRRPIDREAIATRVILGRQMPTGEETPDPITWDDTMGQTLYGIEPYEQLDLWTRDDSDLGKVANRALAMRSYATMPRIDWVELDASTSNQALDALTTASPFTPTRWRCVLTEQRGAVFDEMCYVTGLTEDFTPEGWTARVSLDRSDIFATAGPGEWDAAYFDRSQWS